MNFCPSCGAKLTGPDATFCSNCGYKLEHSPLAEESLQRKAGDEIHGPLVSPEFYDMVSSRHDRYRKWEAVFNTSIINSAGEWFGPPRVSSKELFRDSAPELGRMLEESGDWMANAIMSRSFTLIPHGLPTGSEMNPRIDPRMPISESPNGQRLQRLIAEMGVFMNVWPEGEALVGWWPSPGGGRVVEIAEILRNPLGREYLYWYSTPLFSAGALPNNDVAHISVTVAIPTALETICYLSECPTPLEIGTLLALGGRGPVLFGPKDTFVEYPVPVARLSAGGNARGTTFLGCTGAENLTATYFAGAKVDMGLAIDLQAPDSALRRAIQVAVISAQRTAAIFEDGFANHAGGELAFGAMMQSQSAVAKSDEQTWVPTCIANQMGDILIRAG
jgi:hypothetical protein